jgi:CheY-like chemotaxis protein
MREPIEVLVVDDDPSIREVVVELLSLEGCLTLEARSGRTALDLLRARRIPPAVILLDLLMPDMDGWRFRAEQLTDPALSAIPVIVISAMRWDLVRHISRSAATSSCAPWRGSSSDLRSLTLPPLSRGSSIRQAAARPPSQRLHKRRLTNLRGERAPG